jgi:hypothetical protein
MLRGFFIRLLKPLSRLLLRTVPLDDPWERFTHDVPLGRYGAGARRDFGWYLEGESRVAVASVDEVQDWLLGCQYLRDPDLFHEADFWQHPLTFEHLRKGDCEDFSLWAWRKLVEMGYDAELVAGRCLHAGEPACCHTWILFRNDDRSFLFDPVVRERTRMICALDEVRAAYLPEVSVDGRLTRYAYAGYYQQLSGEARQKKASRPRPKRERLASVTAAS